MAHIDPAFGFYRHSIDDHDGYAADVATLSTSAGGTSYDGTKVTFATGVVVVPLATLPATDPHVAGQLYLGAAGALKISSGP